jgi:twitching motility two-component system response regulator PilH
MSGIDFLKRLLGGSGTQERETPRYAQATNGLRVLMVDDSPTMLAVMGRMLDQEGYASLRAEDGESALEMAREEQPSLIFLDIVLPGMNGFAVLRALRHDPATQDIPIVMISGNQQATEQFYVQRFGADDFIKKPFGRVEVTACIHKLVLSGRLPAREIVREVVQVVPAVQDVAVPVPVEEAEAQVSVASIAA